MEIITGTSASDLANIYDANAEDGGKSNVFFGRVWVGWGGKDLINTRPTVFVGIGVEEGLFRQELLTTIK